MLARVISRASPVVSRTVRCFGASPEPSAPWQVRSTSQIVSKGLRETGIALKEESGDTVFSVRRPVMSLLGTSPTMANDAFVAPSASVIGEVTLFDRASVWYSAVVRGDHNKITLGAFSNIQDRAVVNTVGTLDTGFPSIVDIGNWTSIGAASVLTSCTIGNKCEIGEGCVIGEGAVVADECILLAGTVVPAGSYLESGRWGGNPATKVGSLDADGHDAEHIVTHAENIAYVAEDHVKEYLPFGNAYKHLEEVVETGSVEGAK